MNDDRRKLALDRLKALSDGVFAIVLTILVLGLDVPDPELFKTRGVWGMLLAMEPQLRPYFACFMGIAVMWITQVVIFHYIQGVSRPFVWLNLLFFFFVTLNPFLTEMRATHVGNGDVAILYSSALTIEFLLLWVIWRRAVFHLRDKPLSRDVIWSFDFRIFGAIGFCILGAALAPINERLATLMFVGVPALFLVHRKLDGGWQQDDSTAT